MEESVTSRSEPCRVYVAPARRLYVVAHIRDIDVTVCGLNIQEPEELWRVVPAEDVDRVCQSCEGSDTDATLW